MQNSKQIGIYLDHAKAHLFRFDSSSFTLINSDFSDEDREAGLKKSEKKMHVKEQHQQHEFYSKLENVIKDYHSVLLFGPTDSKKELSNILKEKARLSEIKIHVEATDKLSENQQAAFVNEYFKKSI